VWFIVRGKYDNTYTGIELPEMFGGFQPVDEGHVDVQQDDVRLLYGEQVEEFFAISSRVSDH
jgi:hypothetical protein